MIILIDLDKELEPENLTQKDIMTYLLHSTQHTATREEVQDVKNELKFEIQKVEQRIDKVEISLKKEIQKVDQRIDKIDAKIDKVDAKFDKITWLIISTIATVLLKDYIIDIFKNLSH